MGMGLPPLRAYNLWTILGDTMIDESVYVWDPISGEHRVTTIPEVTDSDIIVGYFTFKAYHKLEKGDD
jgi:hypothetical protein